MNARVESIKKKLADRDHQLQELKAAVEASFAMRDAVEGLQLDVSESNLQLESARARITEMEKHAQFSDNLKRRASK
jgi:hypothetical protein